MTFSKTVAKAMAIGGILVAALIYGIFANSLSETDMVTLAYFWVPVSAAGAAIWATGRNTLKYALTIFVAALAFLFLFFEVIFPML